jgi:hypothetical protein
MRLSIGEKLLVLRKRAGMSLCEVGEAAFPELKAAHIKVKKLEDGTQLPSDEEIERLSKVLRADIQQLVPPGTQHLENGGYYVSHEVFDMFPKLREYLDFLYSAVRIGHRAAGESTFKRMAEDTDLIKPAVNH